jgi:hypothetical protein
MLSVLRALGIFRRGFYTYAQDFLDCDPSIYAPEVAGMTDAYHHAPDGVSLTSYAVLNCDPPDLHLPSSWNYRCKLSCPTLFLKF